MKKYLVLLSVLGLTACGGGGGGVGMGGAPRAVVLKDSVAESNSVLTNMVSNSKTQVTVYVAKKLGEDASTVGLGNVGRSATTRGSFLPSANVGSGLDYDKAQELIELAEWLGNDSTSDQDIMAKFNTSTDDKNKIKAALKLLDGDQYFNGDSAEATANQIITQRSANAFVTQLAELHQRSEIMTLDGVDLFNSEGYRLKFNVDSDGKIISYEYPDFVTHNADGTTTVYEDINVYDSDDNPIGQLHNPAEDDSDGLIMRKGDTNRFVQESSIPLSEMNDENPDANFVSPENITNVNGIIKLKLYDEYISYAKQLGLRHSDFGIMKDDFTNATFTATGLNAAGKQEIRKFIDAWGVMITPFAGGYASKKMSDSEMTTLAGDATDNKMTFKGIAVADVRYRDGFAYNGNGIDIPLTDDMMTDNNATLVFDDTGTQTLTADFSANWYKIQAIEDADGTTNRLVVFGDRNGDDSPDSVFKTVVYDGDVYGGYDGNEYDSSVGDPFGSKNVSYNPSTNKTTVTYNFTLGSSSADIIGGSNVQITGNDTDGWFANGESMTFTPNYYGDREPNLDPKEGVATMHYQYQQNTALNKVDDGHGGFTFEDANGGEGNINIELGFGGTLQQPAQP